MGIQSFEALPGKLSAALGGIDLFAAEQLERFYSHHNRPAIPVYGQQIAGAIRGDVDAVAPVSLAGGEEAEKLFDGMFDDITSKFLTTFKKAGRTNKKVVALPPLALRAKISYNIGAGRVCYG